MTCRIVIPAYFVAPDGTELCSEDCPLVSHCHSEAEVVAVPDDCPGPGAYLVIEESMALELPPEGTMDAKRLVDRCSEAAYYASPWPDGPPMDWLRAKMEMMDQTTALKMLVQHVLSAARGETEKKESTP